MLTEKEVTRLRDELETAKNPLFFFHDDPDGLASFLLLYRKAKEGRGVCVKAFPELTTAFLHKIEETEPDKIFVLDIAMVDQDFIDNAKAPVIWIDHHTPIKREKASYFNPRLQQEHLNVPASYLCWQVVQQDIWIAMAGCVSDWFWPGFAEEFRKKYPLLLPESINCVEDALFKSQLGELVKILSFNLKGATSEVNKTIKVLTRIEHPDEILKQQTPKGRFIYKKYEKIEKMYLALKQRALSQVKKGPLLVFTYSEDNLSLTKDLANELLYLYPDKVIVLGREKSGEVRCSLRAGRQINLQKALQKALEGIGGYGGGHEQACGAAIKQEDFARFLEQLKQALGNADK